MAGSEEFNTRTMVEDQCFRELFSAPPGTGTRVGTARWPRVLGTAADTTKAELTGVECTAFETRGWSTQ